MPDTTAPATPGTLAPVNASLAFTGSTDDAPMWPPWVARTTTQTGLSRTAYGAGLYIVFPASGTGYVTSPDGVTWTARTLPVTGTWSQVLYAGGQFVAVNSTASTVVLTSPDGTTWTQRTLPTSVALRAVAYGNSTYVAVGASGACMTSPDGVTWTSRAGQLSNVTFIGVAFGAGLFVTVGGSVLSYSSPDGVTWTARTLPVSTTAWASITYAAGLFLAVQTGSAACLVSPDWVTITSRTLPGTPGAGNTVYGNGQWMIFLATGGFYYSSWDTINWVARWVPAFTSAQSWPGYGNGLFFYASGGTVYTQAAPAAEDTAGGITAYCLYAQDPTPGYQWLPASAPTVPYLQSMAYGGGRFVAVPNVNGPAQAMVSPDGLGWTQRSTLPYSGYGWRIAYGAGTFVAVASTANAVALTSPDGLTWTSRTTPGNSYQWITYGAGLFVAVNGTTNASTSPDGITWTQRTLPLSQTWLRVAYGGGQFLAVSNSTTYATSPDGLTWTSRTLPATASWYGLAYGAGLWVLMSQASSSTTYYTSPDGITWTSRTLPVATGVFQVVWTGTVFVAAPNGSATALVSADGLTWTVTTLPVSASWAVAYNPDQQTVAAVTTNATLTGGFLAAALVAVPPSGTTDGLISVAQPALNTWTKTTVPSPGASSANYSGTAITYGAGMLLAISSPGNVVVTSTDGVTWTLRTTNLPATAGYTWGVAYGNGLFVAVRNDGSCYSSPDGLTWTARGQLASYTTYGPVTFGGGRFIVVVTTAGAYCTSTDGMNWSAVTTLPTSLSTAGTATAISWGAGQWVIVSSAVAYAWYSSDGAAWTQVATPAPALAVAYGAGQFLAATAGSTVSLTSPDGVTWMTRTGYQTAGYTQLVCAAGVWVGAVGSTIGISGDGGSTWTASSPGSGAGAPYYGFGVAGLLPAGAALTTAFYAGLTGTAVVPPDVKNLTVAGRDAAGNLSPRSPVLATPLGSGSGGGSVRTSGQLWPR
jgi:hypothetical protein